MSISILYARPFDCKFAHITTGDGLSSNVVYHVLQDRRGFMWFATSEGLCRYDGYSIKEYVYSPLDSTSISSSWCSELYEDHLGYIWIGTVYGGLNRFDPTTEKFIHFKNDPDDSTTINAYVVFGISQDSRGAFWLGTWNGLDRLVISRDPQTNEEQFEFTHYQHDPKNLNSLSDNRIWHIFLDKFDILWISTQDSGLVKFDIANEMFTRYQHDPDNPNSISFDRVRYVYEDPLGNGDILWVGTLGGLNKFDKSTDKFVRFLHDDDNNFSLSDNGVVPIFRDSKGNLWIGTRGGLNIYDEENETFYHCEYDTTNVKSISSDFVYSICEDRNGVLWFGTINGGVDRLLNERKKFNVFEGTAKNSKFKELKSMYIIYEDSDGILWFGTEFGLYQFDRTKEQIVHYKHDPENENSLIFNSVYSIFEEPNCMDKTLWIACYGGGLDRLTLHKNEQTGEEIPYFKHFTHDPNDPSSISSDCVYKIFQDGTGKLWIATCDGLNYFDRQNEKFARYFHDPDNHTSLSHNRVNVIHQSPRDSTNILWIGTSAGLNKFYTDKHEFIRYTHNKVDSNSINYDFICSICRNLTAEGDILWIGTFGGGLERFDIETEQFTHFTSDDGLNSNQIYSIIEDIHGYLWLSTLKGISRFDPRTATFINYNRDDGILEHIHYSESHYVTNDGKIYISGGSGFISFYPDSIEENSFIPPIVITDFKVFNKTVQLGKSITAIERIDLSHRQNFFSFEFAALDYTNPKKNQYAYKLDGVDADWIYCGDRRQAFYTNIRPGEYRFRIKGSNNDGIWNEEGESIRLRIIPPFWMTTWFRTLMVIIFLVSLVSFYEMRMSILMKEKKLQQSFSQRLIEDLEKGRKRFAGELHDSLGQNLLIIKNELQQIISKFSDQILLENELNTVSSLVSESIDEIRQIATDLHPHHLDRLGLKKAIEALLYKFVHSTDIEFIIDMDEIDELFPKSFEIHIFRLIQEGLSNIVKHADATIVHIEIKNKVKYAQIIIGDNGKGFNVKLYQSGKVEYQGFGLTGMSERIKILEGKLKIDSNPGKGTKIIIQIPIDIKT
ncbi:hypothetical protein JXB12_04455 [candidate division KSB1 bacterium]|nr:hypothetical protein [candidate division KSB1 bacterium]